MGRRWKESVLCKYKWKDASKNAFDAISQGFKPISFKRYEKLKMKRAKNVILSRHHVKTNVWRWKWFMKKEEA